MSYIYVTVAGSGTGSENTVKPIPTNDIVAVTGGSTSTVITYAMDSDKNQIITLTHAAVGSGVPTFIKLVVDALRKSQQEPSNLVSIDTSAYAVSDCVQSHS
jgi:ABC-type enterobactin transport system permease subunit